MNNQNNIIKHMVAASALALSLAGASAWAADTAAPTPPAHQQKQQVPNNTSTGNYLPDQQDNNGATGDTTTNKHGDKAGGNKKGANAKPTNLEKSERFTEQPADGGTNVKQ